MYRSLVLIALLSASLPATVLAGRPRAQPLAPEIVRAIGEIESIGVLPPRVEVVEVDRRGAVRRVNTLEGSSARELLAHLTDALQQRRFEARIAQPGQSDIAGRGLDALHAAVTASLNGDAPRDISAEASLLAQQAGVQALLVTNYYQECTRRWGGLGFNLGSAFPSDARAIVVVVVVIIVVVAIAAALNVDRPPRATYERLEVGLIDGKSGEILWARRTAGNRPMFIRTISTTLRSLPWKRMDHATSPADL